MGGVSQSKWKQTETPMQDTAERGFGFSACREPVYEHTRRLPRAHKASAGEPGNNRRLRARQVVRTDEEMSEEECTEMWQPVRTWSHQA